MDETLSPDEQAIAAARAQHSGTVVSIVGPPGRQYSWRCQCGSGRDTSASTDWEIAAEELHAHEVRTIVAALDLPARDASIRADERAAVRRELLSDETSDAVAEATEAHHIVYDQTDAMGHNPCVCGGWWDSIEVEGWDQHWASVALRAAADRIAPEHTPGEKP